METALSLLDKGRPVFPLDIVKTLRDQRAMMVQTTVQRSRTRAGAKKLGSYSTNDTFTRTVVFFFFKLISLSVSTFSI